MGYAEGGLIALYAAALDTRIDAACISGYFAPREHVWEEPIYRNVFSLLREFGDAELASLVAPRALVIEAAHVPEVSGPPKPGPGVSGGAAPGQARRRPMPSPIVAAKSSAPADSPGWHGKCRKSIAPGGVRPAGDARRRWPAFLQVPAQLTR